MMKKFLLAMTVVFVLTIPLSSVSQATWWYCNFNREGWKIPDNVRIVQQSDTDNVRVFPAVNAALASIPETALPCGKERYLVKIMPGVYPESVVLPACVDLEGSGPENTTIQSMVEEDDDYFEPTGATVVITGDSSVSELSVVNSGITSGYAVVFLGSGKGRNLDVRVESQFDGGGALAGIFAWGEATEVVLDHIVVRSSSTGVERDVHGIGTRAASLFLKDSTVSASGGSWAVAAFFAGTGEGSLDVRDSVLEASGSPSSSALERRHGLATVRVSGTRMATGQCSTGCTAVLGVAGTTTEVIQSDLVGDVFAAKVAGSKLSGRIGALSTITGCWDADLAPLPDQIP